MAAQWNAILFGMEQSKEVAEHVWSYLKKECTLAIRRKLREAFLCSVVEYCRELQKENAQKDELIEGLKIELDAERERVQLTIEGIKEDAAGFVKIKALLGKFSNDQDDTDTKIAKREECLKVC